MTVSPTRIDADDVRAELRVDDVIRHYGIKVRRRGSQYLPSECPRCHQAAKRQAIAINASTGEWLHHGHDFQAGGTCGGDLLELVAACEGWDSRRDFPRLVARCAEIAGIDTQSLTERERIERRIRRDRELADRRRLADLENRERRERALVVASAHWNRLARRHEAGEAYLRGRGIEPATLIERNLVRFEACGNVAVAIHTADGRVISVVRRLLSPREDSPKVLTLAGCPSTGTLVGALPEIVHGRDVVLVEGITDALTACLAWPTAVVLGANGAGSLARIARAAAHRVRLAGTRLLLVPDDDDAGVSAMIAAGREAVAAGLELRRTLVVIDDFEAKDLTAAWAGGWRPEGNVR